MTQLRRVLSHEPSSIAKPDFWQRSLSGGVGGLEEMSHCFPWTRPTDEVYASVNSHPDDGDDGTVSEPFREAREALDYGYHKKPVLERQCLQDTILRGAVTAPDGALPAADQRPWLVFTAGAMGVGKSHALLSLNVAGLFPLEQFQLIDPDKLKGQLPELRGYLLFDRPSAATKLHRESSQMAEVLFEHSLRRGAHVLVDGSLRDHKWYSQLFTRLRERFPRFRLAIVHVTAPADVVCRRTWQRPPSRHRRVAERAATSPDGRAVPRELVDASLAAVPESAPIRVRILTPLVDYVCCVENGDNGLVLQTGGANWGEFAAVWGQPPPPRRIASCSNLSCARRAHDRALLRRAMHLWDRPYPNTCARCIVHGYLEVCACYATRPEGSVAAFKRLEKSRVGYALLHRLGWYDTPPKNGPVGRQAAPEQERAPEAHRGEDSSITSVCSETNSPRTHDETGNRC